MDAGGRGARGGMLGAGGDVAGEGGAGLFISIAESKDGSCPLPSACLVRGSESPSSKRGSFPLLPQTRSSPAEGKAGPGRWDNADGESQIPHACGVLAD